jgi:hypothetical protein
MNLLMRVEGLHSLYTLMPEKVTWSLTGKAVLPYSAHRNRARRPPDSGEMQIEYISDKHNGIERHL